MTKVYGAAGQHAARKSVEAFKRMFLTLTGVVGGLALAEGVLFTALFMSRGKPSVLLSLAIAFAFAVILICRRISDRIDKYETERMSWRMGALGEAEVAAELDGLSEDFTIFNNVNTKRGNLDHVVIGPTGLFAIETKNWTGLIVAAPDGELVKNGHPATVPHVRKFVSRAMMMRDQVIALTGSDKFWVRSVMVFPKAHIDAPYGKTGKAHCVRLSKLRDYIEDPKYSAKLTHARVHELVRAMEGVANMDVDFMEGAADAISRGRDDAVLADPALTV